ncbi:unnamed protein product [Chrysoparadoxa australica]
MQGYLLSSLVFALALLHARSDAFQLIETSSLTGGHSMGLARTGGQSTGLARTGAQSTRFAALYHQRLPVGSGDSDSTELENALQQEAMARALLRDQIARRRQLERREALALRVQSPNPPATAESMRVQVERDDDVPLLRIVVPARGFNLMSDGFTAMFSVGWFASIGAWTAGAAATGPVAVAFSIPFWGAGAVMAKQAFIDPFTRAELKIGEFGWEVRSELKGKLFGSETSGASNEIRCATVRVAGYVNEVPQYVLVLETGRGEINTFGAIELAEQEYIRDQINDFLTYLREDRPKAIGKEFLSCWLEERESAAYLLQCSAMLLVIGPLMLLALWKPTPVNILAHPYTTSSLFLLTYSTAVGS